MSCWVSSDRQADASELHNFPISWFQGPCLGQFGVHFRCRWQTKEQGWWVGRLLRDRFCAEGIRSVGSCLATDEALPGLSMSPDR